MRKLMLSGRTVRVSEQVEFENDNGKKGKITYVTLAIRDKYAKNDESDDMITIRYWNDRSEWAQKHLNLHDPSKVKALKEVLAKHNVDSYFKLPADVKKKVNANTIHSRVISVSGDFKMFTKLVQANAKVKNGEKVLALPSKTKVKYDGKTLSLPYMFEQNQFVVDETYDTTLLDARPKWARTNNTSEETEVEVEEVEVEVIEDEESSNSSGGVVVNGETIPDSDIPA